jgi:uncharacterized protein YukE
MVHATGMGAACVSTRRHTRAHLWQQPEQHVKEQVRVLRRAGRVLRRAQHSAQHVRRQVAAE